MATDEKVKTKKHTGTPTKETTKKDKETTKKDKEKTKKDKEKTKNDTGTPNKEKPKRKTKSSEKSSDDQTPELKTWRTKGKGGKFKQAEAEQLEQYFLKYASDHGWDEAHIQKVVGSGKKNYKGVWNEIAAVLPHRSIQACREYIMRRFHEGNHRGQWSQEDIDTLRAFVAQNGPKWTEIAQRLDRTPHNCRDQWREVEFIEVKSKSRWSSEECNKLIELIKRLTNGNIEAAKSGLNWTVIARVMKTRSHSQCASKWNSHLYPLLTGTGRFSKSDDLELIQHIWDCGAEDEVEVSWKDLHPVWNAHQARRRFKSLMKGVPNAVRLSFSDIVDYLLKELREINENDERLRAEIDKDLEEAEAEAEAEQTEKEGADNEKASGANKKMKGKTDAKSSEKEQKKKKPIESEEDGEEKKLKKKHSSKKKDTKAKEDQSIENETNGDASVHEAEKKQKKRKRESKSNASDAEHNEHNGVEEEHMETTTPSKRKKEGKTDERMETDEAPVVVEAERKKKKHKREAPTDQETVETEDAEQEVETEKKKKSKRKKEDSPAVQTEKKHKKQRRESPLTSSGEHPIESNGGEEDDQSEKQTKKKRKDKKKQ